MFPAVINQLYVTAPPALHVGVCWVLTQPAQEYTGASWPLHRLGSHDLLWSLYTSPPDCLKEAAQRHCCAPVLTVCLQLIPSVDLAVWIPAELGALTGFHYYGELRLLNILIVMSSLRVDIFFYWWSWYGNETKPGSPGGQNCTSVRDYNGRL